MIVTNSFLIVGATIFAVLCLILFSVGACMKIYQLYSKPNERVIQITIDRTFFPAMWYSLLVVIFFIGSVDFIDRTKKHFLLDQEGVIGHGFIGSVPLLKRLTVHEDTKCDHVTKKEGKIAIHISGDEAIPSTCGVSAESIQEYYSHSLISFKDHEQIIIGKWPFETILNVKNHTVEPPNPQG